MSESIDYHINYDEESLREQVKEEGPNPLLDLRIEVDGEDVKGAEKGEYHLDDFIGMHVVRLLDAVMKLRQGDPVEFHFYSHPQVLVLEPINGQLSIACMSPSRVDDISKEDKYTVEKESFIQEVLRVAEEFIERMVEIDKTLADHDRIQEIEQRIATIRNTQ